MKKRSIVITLGVLMVCMIVSSGTSAQLLLKKVVNKQQLAGTRQRIFVASTAKLDASESEDSGQGPSQSVNAGASFTVPDLGDGFHVIPTPSFNYTNVADIKSWGFTAQVWGNSLGIDSNKQHAAGNLLVPDISILGLKMEGAYLFSSDATSDFIVGADLDVNLLVKKVSFFDTTSNVSTNFNPLVFHPRVGFTGALKSIFFVSVYGNMLSILTHNDDFSNFFATKKKSTFGYPEIDAAAIVNLDNTGKQQIKFEFDLLINNGDLQTIYNSADKVIPFVKVGLVTSL